ncbi:MAG: ribulose-phosphate 3-epimerase [Nitriliruptoraceae bacterium]
MWETRIAPSILSADFSRLADEIATVADDVDMIHVDVMDGHYVPNITLGPPIVRSIRPTTDRLLDCHLMIMDPRTYAPQFLEAGAESVTFHPEVDDDPLSLVHDLHERGGLVGVAIRPAHPVSMVDELLADVDMLLVMTVEPGFGGQALIPDALSKVTEAVRLRDERGLRFRIQVDGGIARGTIDAAARAGADTFVAGSAVFGGEDRGARCRELHALAEAAQADRR